MPRVSLERFLEGVQFAFGLSYYESEHFGSSRVIVDGILVIVATPGVCHLYRQHGKSVSLAPASLSILPFLFAAAISFAYRPVSLKRTGMGAARDGLPALLGCESRTSKLAIHPTDSVYSIDLPLLQRSSTRSGSGVHREIGVPGRVSRFRPSRRSSRPLT